MPLRWVETDIGLAKTKLDSVEVADTPVHGNVLAAVQGLKAVVLFALEQVP